MMGITQTLQLAQVGPFANEILGLVWPLIVAMAGLSLGFWIARSIRALVRGRR